MNNPKIHLVDDISCDIDSNYDYDYYLNSLREFFENIHNIYS